MKTERGGQVTFHNPGQLVVYPILNLQHFIPNVRWYVEKLQRVMQSALEQVGMRDTVLDSGVGVWTKDGEKVASIGIQIKNWVTMHGFSINVSNSLEPFSLTEICGQSNIKMGRVCNYVPAISNASMLIDPLLDSFGKVMDMQLVEQQTLTLPQL